MHIVYIHEKKDRPLSKCKICGENVQSLKKHNETNHVTEVFPCNECPKTFQEKYEVKKHMQIHTGEKSYICSFCEKNLNKKLILR